MTSGSVQLVLTSKLRNIAMSYGSLHLNNDEDRESTQPPKKVSVNLAELPLNAFHELHQGVADELKV